MTEPNSVHLHRVFATSPDKLYRAFADAAAMAKWLPPNGFTCTVDHFEARPGGTFRMAFTNFTSGDSHSFGGAFSSRMEAKDGSMGFDFAGTYTAIEPTRLIAYAFGDREAQVTFEDKPGGATVTVQFDTEDEHPAEMQRGGWQAILGNFARHVEGGAGNQSA